MLKSRNRWLLKHAKTQNDILYIFTVSEHTEKQVDYEYF